MANQKLKIRWENRPSALFNMFQKSLQKEQFVDVTLTSADGQSIECHRLVLSASSPYFHRILSNSSSVILLTNIKYWQLKALVDFMYSGEVCVRQERLQELHKAAKELEIKGFGLPDGYLIDKVAQVGPPKRNNHLGGPSMKRKLRIEPPRLVTPKMQRTSSGDGGVGKGLDLEAAGAGLVLPPKTTTGRPLEDDDRAERLKKASEFVRNFTVTRYC